MTFEAQVLEQLAGIRGALERIAGALDMVTQPDEPVAAATDAACLHPGDVRIDFGMTNGRPDWQCGACGYRSTAEAGA